MDEYIQNEMKRFAIDLMETAWIFGAKRNRKKIKDLKRLRKILRNNVKILDILIRIAEINEQGA